MKGAIALVLLSLTCSACGRSDARATPSQAYRSWSDKFAVAVGLPPFSCTHKVKDKFGEYYASIPEDQCVKFDPPQRWHGFWRDDFEGRCFVLLRRRHAATSTMTVDRSR
jgi:hypothetical protein